MKKEYQYFFIQTMVKEGIEATEIHRILSDAWGINNVLSKRRVQHVAKEYRENDRMVCKRREGSGAPRMARVEQSVEHVQLLIQENPHISIQEISDITEISWSSVQRILTKDLQLRSLCARWIPHSLTDRMKQQRIRESEILLRDLMATVFVIDEKWLYQNYLPPTQHIRVWADEAGDRRADRPIIVRRMMCDIKYHIIVAINFRGEFYCEVLERQETVNAARYIQFLQNLLNIPRRPPTIMYDNARPHKAKATEDFLIQHGIQRIPQPPYSPDVNFCDRFVFRNMEVARKNLTLNNVEEAKEFVNNFLQNLNRPSLDRELTRLRNDLQKIIDNNGEYLTTV